MTDLASCLAALASLDADDDAFCEAETCVECGSMLLVAPAPDPRYAALRALTGQLAALLAPAAPAGAPEPRPAPLATRKRPVRLPRRAYSAAYAVEAGLAPDLVAPFRAVWRSLWPSLGRATLAEAFAEWCEAHPSELIALQCEAIERRTDRMVRAHDRADFDVEAIEREAMAS